MQKISIKPKKGWFSKILDHTNVIHSTSRLDILVNNAGAGYFGKQTTDGLLTLMLTNYFGPFFLTNLLIGRYLSNIFTVR